jgi:hypothetical protein
VPQCPIAGDATGYTEIVATIRIRNHGPSIDWLRHIWSRTPSSDRTLLSAAIENKKNEYSFERVHVKQ